MSEKSVGEHLKSTPKYLIDGALTILNLPVNAVASLVDVAHDGKLDRPFLDNSFSEMYADHLKNSNKEIKIRDRIAGLAMDIFLDPTTYLGGAVGKFGQLDEALKIAKGAGKIQDIATISKADDALKAIAAAKKTLENTKEGKKALKILNAAEPILKSKSGEKTLAKVVQKNTPQLITPDNWAKEGWGESLKQAFVSDNIKLMPSEVTAKKKKTLEKIVKADYTDEIAQAKNIIEEMKDLEKGFSTLQKKGLEALTPKLEQAVIKRTGGTAIDAQNKYSKFLRAQETIQRLGAKKEIELYSIKGVENFFNSGSINEVLKVDESLELLAKKEAKKNSEVFEALAKENKMNPKEWNREIIDYIETGSKGHLNASSLEKAEEIKKTFSTLRELDQVATGKNLSRITGERYIPRVFNMAMSTGEAKNKFAQLTISGGKERLTKNSSFLELQKALDGKGEALLKDDIAELIQIATRRTHERIKLDTLRNGIKPYIQTKAGKGLELIDHPIVNVYNNIKKNPEEFIEAVKKSGISAEDASKIDGLNWKALSKKMPEIFGEEKAKELMKMAFKAEKAPAFLPKPVLDKLTPVITRNRSYDSTWSKMLYGLRQYNQAWKKWTLAPIPQFHLNNYVDNLNRLGVHEPKAVLNLKKAGDLQAGKTIMIKTPQGKKALMLDDLIQGGITGGKYSIKEFEDLQKASKALKDSSPKNILTKTGTVFASFVRGDVKAIDKAFDFGNLVEDQSRIMLAIAELEKGHSMKDAAKRVTEIFYDSNVLPEFIKGMRDHVFPFAGFTYQNTKAGVRAFTKHPGRAMIPLKAVRASRAGEEKFLAEDKIADGRTALRITKGSSISLSPKASQLEIVDIFDTIADAQDPAKGFMNVLIGYSGPYRAVVEGAVNRDFKRDDTIDKVEEKGTGSKTEKFFGVDINKRVMHVVQGHARLLRIIDNALQDEEGNYAWDYVEQYGANKPLQVVANNLPAVLFGGTYNRNLEKASQRAVREAGERASFYKKEAQNMVKQMRETRDGEKRLKLKTRYEKMKDAYREEILTQREIKSEYGKVRREMNEIMKEKKSKKSFEIHFNNLFDKNIKSLEGEGTEVEVISVLDGDTITVRMPNGTAEWMRLAGIDAPDDRAKEASTGVFAKLSDAQNKMYYLQSKKQLEKLLEGKTITIKTATKKKRDQFGRPIVRVFSDGIDVNKEMIRQGLVRPSFRGELEKSYADEITEALNEAKKNKKNLWGIL